jgi:GAF domain-containing protein
MPNESELLREAEQDVLTARLQDMVLESADVQEFLDGLVRVAVDSFSRADEEVFCGITLLRPHSAATVASSSIEAQAMDEVQYGYGDGPCLKAARDGETVHIVDFLQETRFPEYREAIAHHGVRSALGVPIQLDAGASAGLDFYSRRPNAFSDEAMALAQGFACQVSRSLRLAVNMARLSDDLAHRQKAMESRTAIDMAVGAIMAQNRCDQEQAMTILRRASSARNIKLRDLALELLASVGQSSAPLTHFD